MFRRFFAGGFPGDVREGLNDGAVTQALPLAEDVLAQEVSMKRSLLGPPSLAIEVLRAAKIDLLSVQRKQLVSTLRF